MLYPKIVGVSEKGQIVIPAEMRKALGIKPKGKVFVVPDKKGGKLEVKPIGGRDILEHLHGIFADVDKGRSWTKELLEERKRDLIREETKFDSIFKKKKSKK